MDSNDIILRFLQKKAWRPPHPPSLQNVVGLGRGIAGAANDITNKVSPEDAAALGEGPQTGEWHPELGMAGLDAGLGAASYLGGRKPGVTGTNFEQLKNSWKATNPRNTLPNMAGALGSVAKAGVVGGSALAAAPELVSAWRDPENRGAHLGNAALYGGAGGAGYLAAKAGPALQPAITKGVRGVLGNTAARMVGKAVGSHILPGVASAMDINYGMNKFKEPGLLNKAQGAMSLVSAGANFLPPVGPLVSTGIDMANQGVDVWKNLNTQPSKFMEPPRQSTATQAPQAGGNLPKHNGLVPLDPKLMSINDRVGSWFGASPPMVKPEWQTQQLSAQGKPTGTKPSPSPQQKTSPIAPQIQEQPRAAIPFASNPQTQNTQMKTANTQFRQDLENPEAGLDADLYSAINPMISPEANSGADSSRINALKEQVRKGLVGMQYATGLKQNSGETFYDKHPVQAVTSDLAKNSLPIGAAVAGGGVLKNILNQWSNMDKTEPASMAREGNPGVDRTNSSTLLDPGKGRSRPDIARTFGDFEDNAEKRLGILDRLGKTPAKDKKSLLERFKKAKGTAAKQKILNEARNSTSSSALSSYADVYESLQKAQGKGGLKEYIGEGLHSLKGKGALGDFISEHLAPGKHQAIGDLFEKHNLTGANPHFDEELVKDIVKEYRRGGDFSLDKDPKGKAFVDTTLKDLQNMKHQGSWLRKNLSKHKLPLLAGGAIAAGGVGLQHLLKAIQNRSHSSDQIKDWKKTLLKSRGEFDRANQIQ